MCEIIMILMILLIMKWNENEIYVNNNIISNVYY